VKFYRSGRRPGSFFRVVSDGSAVSPLNVEKGVFHQSLLITFGAAKAFAKFEIKEQRGNILSVL